jgi:hypothetical protein
VQDEGPKPFDRARLRALALAGAIALVAAAGVRAAGAHAGGTPDQARLGCGGSCHGGGVLPANTTTVVLLQGLPGEGYVPGCGYDLDVRVLGVAYAERVAIAVPVLPLAGFNLEVTAGTLVGGPGVVAWPETDCDVLARTEDCEPGSANDPCSRACDDETSFVRQVSHAKRDPADHANPNRFAWQARWQAPEAGAGPVTVHVAGAVTNGNSRKDPGDPWTVNPEVVLPELPAGPCP